MSYPLTNTVGDRIKARKNNILYRRKGKRYVPVNDPWAYDGLREGSWYVRVKEGCTSIRAAVWPDRMEIQAALFDLEEQLVDLIRQASEARPKSARLSPAEKRAWDKLIEVGGDSFKMLHYQSLQGIADEVLGHVKNRLVKRGAIPALDAEKDHNAHE